MATRKIARNPANQRILDMKYKASAELEFAVDWAIVNITADCVLLCNRIDEDFYELNFTAKKDNFSFDVFHKVERDKMEFLMGGGFPIGETKKLHNNFSLPESEKQQGAIEAEYKMVV